MSWNQEAVHKEWLNKKIWAHLISVMIVDFARTSSSVRSTFIRIWNSHIYLYCIIFKFKLFKNVFLLLFSKHMCQTTYIPSHTMKTMSKIQSEHTQSLHYKNIIRHFFMCLNHILPIKFHYATFDFAPSHATSLETTFILFHILTALSNTTETKFVWNFMLLIVNFPHILPCFD